jgi:peptide/nickel transport system permease protein
MTDLIASGVKDRRNRVLILLRRGPTNWVPTLCLLYLIGAFAIAWIGPSLGTGDPETMYPAYSFTSPSVEYPMGNDYLGRSVLSRVVFALRVSLVLSAVSAMLAAIAGTFIGITVGYLKGWADEIVMRIMDILFAFPSILLAILIATVLGPSIYSVVVIIFVISLPSFTRMVRGPTLSICETEYVSAAQAVGASRIRIIFRHVLPNVMAPILVQFSYALSVALIIEGSLSFLGLGVQPPTPSLGSLLFDGKKYMELAPWMVLFPGAILALAVVSINVFGDWLRDYFDPRLRGSR